jgi:hypothetical protein
MLTGELHADEKKTAHICYFQNGTQALRSAEGAAWLTEGNEEFVEYMRRLSCVSH